jgi:iron complex outermembrane receptor protein
MKFKKRSHLLSASLTVLFSASPVLAQTDDGESKMALEEVIVTATRRATSMQKTAISMAAMSGSDLEKKGYSSIEERSEERRVGKECRSRWSPYH